jgi:hypothetical protein
LLEAIPMIRTEAIRSRRRALAAGTLVVLLAALALLPAWFVSADDTTEVSGPIVTVNANGGDVRAAGASVTVTGTAANIKAAGADVDVSANAAGSLWAAGARVAVSGNIAGDATVAGATIALTGSIGGNAKVAGAVLDLTGKVTGNAKLGGASVSIATNSEIGGSLDVGAANTKFGGHVTGPVTISGAAITFAGTADADVKLTGAQVIVGPGAHITGNLTVVSNRDAQIDPAATITGQIQRVGPPSWWNSITWWMWAGAIAVVIVLGTVLAGVVLMLFGGRIFTIATDHARLRPLSSFLIGLVTAIIVPAVAIILMATLAGLSIGIGLLLALPLLFVLGHAVAAAGIAAGIFIRSPTPIGIARSLLMLIVGALIIVLIGLIPWVGWIAVFIILLLGFGALVRTIGAKLRAVFVPVAAVPAA